MERTHYKVSANGLHLPLPLIESYGFQPGAEVTVEMGENAMRIVSVAPRQEDIENRALRLLLHRLGDAVTVRCKFVKNDPESRWEVGIGARGTDTILGMLQYSVAGELLTDIDSEVQRVLRNVDKLSAQL